MTTDIRSFFLARAIEGAKNAEHLISTKSIPISDTIESISKEYPTDDLIWYNSPNEDPSLRDSLHLELSNDHQIDAMDWGSPISQENGFKLELSLSTDTVHYTSPVQTPTKTPGLILILK
jgi:hypothetical protein